MKKSANLDALPYVEGVINQMKIFLSQEDFKDEFDIKGSLKEAEFSAGALRGYPKILDANGCCEYLETFLNKCEQHYRKNHLRSPFYQQIKLTIEKFLL